MILPKITLPWAKTSDLSSNSRLHWRRRAALVRHQKDAATKIAWAHGWHTFRVPEGAQINVHLTFCPPSRGAEPDLDNALTAQKGALDALAGVLRVNDRRFRISMDRGDRSRDGSVIVVMKIGATGKEASRTGGNPSGSDHNPEIGETGMAFEKHITGKAGDQ